MGAATTDTASTQQGKLLHTLLRLLAIKTPALKPALSEASTLVADALGAEKVDTFLHDRESESLIAVGVSSTPLGQLQQNLGLHRLPIANGGRSVQVFQTGITYANGHVESDLEELKGVREALKIRSVVAVALDVEGQRRGVLQVDSIRPEAFYN
jgi:two-component system, OmpR family, sensor kinase